jgi:hypothetical protein
MSEPEFRTKKDSKKHYPISAPSGDQVPKSERPPSIDEEIEKIMAEEQKPIGIEGMELAEAKTIMEQSKNMRYLGSVETNGFTFHEFFSDFSGVYTWCVVGDNGKIAFGGESKSGMLEANEGSSTEADLSKAPEAPPPEPEPVPEPKSDSITPGWVVDTVVPDSIIGEPSNIDSRDKDFMKKQEKKNRQ